MTTTRKISEARRMSNRKNIRTGTMCRCVLSVLIAAALASIGVARENGLRVVESTAHSLTLEFRPVYAAVETVARGTLRCHLLTFSMGVTDEASAGKPDMQFMTVPLALPGRRGTVVDVIGAEYETVSGFDAAPVPTRVAITDTQPVGLLYRCEYSQLTGYYPAAAISIENISGSGGWIMGYLKIYPVQYQAQTRTVKKCTRMVLRITYGPADAATQAASGEPGAASVLVNAAAARAWHAQRPGLVKRAVVSSVRAAGQWFRLEVKTDGMYKIDATFLRALGVDPASLASMREVSIFGGDGHALNTAVRLEADGDPKQLAVSYIDKNANNKFDADDQVLFYGRSANGWTYNGADHTFHHANNPYSASNYYLLRIGSGTPKEMQTLAAPAVTSITTATGFGKAFFDEDKINFLRSGLEWMGAEMRDVSATRIVANKVAGYVKGTPVTYRYRLYGISTVPSSFAIDESGTTIAEEHVSPMTAEEQRNDQGPYATKVDGEATIVPALTDDRSRVRFTYTPGNSLGKGYIDWLEFFYERRLAADGDLLQFSSADLDASVDYRLSGFTTNAVSGYDVTDPWNVKKIDMQLQQAMGEFRFADRLASGTVKQYWTGAATALQTPASFLKLPNTDLHGAVAGADFVIITHHDFAAEAQRLKVHKEQLPSPDSLGTMVVEIDSIYNEFGGGMPDPTAVRNFLLYASLHWKRVPQYVLLFGDASFDYRGISGMGKNRVPTFETEESNDKIATSCTDDYFVRLDTTDDLQMTMGVGRLAVRSADEARFMVNRIIGYEKNSLQGTWRNTITISADDEYVNGNIEERIHTVAAEKLAEEYTPEEFEIRKIFTADYPAVQTSQGRRFPTARQAIIDQVNRGTLILNFTGHGNETVWAHESILSLEDTKAEFFNAGMLTFVVAAACDWGRFDQAGEQSSAEEMMKNSHGGAIGVLSAARRVFADYNAYLNDIFYAYALVPDRNGAAPRLGDACRGAKNNPSSGIVSNKEKYLLLGDPTLRLAIPRMRMTIDSINTVATTSSADDTLRALQKVTIKGAVRNADNTIAPGFNGTAFVTVYDGTRERAIPEFSDPSFRYRQSGAVLYRGENSIVNGRVAASFIVPKDISYDNTNGRISVYFTSGTTDGRGQTTKFIVGGTSAVVATDTEGPELSLCFDTPSYHDGDVVGSDPELIVTLADESGINSTGIGIGHRIEAWIDESAKSIDLTSFYKSMKDSYQQGTVNYQLHDVAAGMHSIVVKAWDVYNNCSTAETSFMSASSDALHLVNVYNFPNPARSATMFTFQHNQLSPLDVKINIYSVAGRLIARIERFAMAERFVQIPWDCRDNDGDLLGNGVYFYKVIASTTDGKYTSESLGKLAVVK